MRSKPSLTTVILIIGIVAALMMIIGGVYVQVALYLTMRDFG